MASESGKVLVSSLVVGQGRRGIGGDCRGVGCGVVVRVRDGGDVELDV